MRATENKPQPISMMERQLPEYSEIFLSPTRLSIMLVLYTNQRVWFTELLKLLALTPDNLDHHLKLLERLGFVTKRRIFSVTRFRMAVEITETGMTAFKMHLQGLKGLIESVGVATPSSAANSE